MNIALLTLLVMLFAASGCTVMRVDSEEIATRYHFPRASTEGILYLKKVDKPHEIIGYVTVQTQRIQPIEKVIEEMKKAAALLGGDAITDIQIDATGLWKKLPPQKLLGHAYVNANFKASVVVFQP